MKITNDNDLPQAIVDAVMNDEYSKGESDISVTSLIDSPRKRALTDKYYEEITEDASERIWALFGQAIHTVLERANRTAVAERRLSMNVGGWIVSGGMDIYEESRGFLRDYKTASVWSLVFGDRGKWENQLNCYAAILRHHGYPVERLQAIAILKDWSKNKAAEDPSYPQRGVVTIEIPVWKNEDALKYMSERVILHRQADFSLPKCSKDDRWIRDEKWAVMKSGRKKSLKNHDSEKSAQFHADELGVGHSVVHRPGKSTRCRSYCSVAQFCTQYQDEQNLPVELEEVS